MACLWFALPPLSAEPLFDFSATLIPPGRLRLSWLSVAGDSYQIQSTTNLVEPWPSYPSHGAIFVARGEELSLSAPVTDTFRFFRVVELDSEPFPLPGMVRLARGTFWMGSRDDEAGREIDEGPLTTVTISRDFWLGKYEVTQKEYSAVMGTNPSHFKGNLDRPVEQVSWNNSVAYCEQLTQQERDAGRLPEGWDYRLPTEAQWEYACRAARDTRYSWGDSDAQMVMKQYCWYEKNAKDGAWTVPHAAEEGTQPVGEKLPNAWGLYDMHGNVWEWCADWYASSHHGGSVSDPLGPTSGSFRLARGGSWFQRAEACRSAERSGYAPWYSFLRLGFRVALVPSRTDEAHLVPEMVWIPPGMFTMGSPDSEEDRLPNEGPQTLVTLSRGFMLGTFEVTQKEYSAVMGANPSHFTGNLNRPVEQVSWNNAMAYCEQLTQQERDAGRLPEGWEYRLPTEAQWEYACRAGTQTRYSWGDSDAESVTKQYCWYKKNAYGPPLWTVSHAAEKGTQPVGEKLPNVWGLYDMHGNVWEWCADWRATYPGGTVTNPVGASSYHAIRGGGWKHDEQYLRSAQRSFSNPSEYDWLLGFRVALIPVP